MEMGSTNAVREALAVGVLLDRLCRLLQKDAQIAQGPRTGL